MIEIIVQKHSPHREKIGYNYDERNTRVILPLQLIGNAPVEEIP